MAAGHCYVFGGLTSYRVQFRTVLTIVFQGCIPIKWTAPEILFGNPAGLSTKSDVYVDVCLKINQIKSYNTAELPVEFTWPISACSLKSKSSLAQNYREKSTATCMGELLTGSHSKLTEYYSIMKTDKENNFSASCQ